MIFWIWYGATLFLLITALGVRIVRELKELRKGHDKILSYDDEKTTDEPAATATGKRKRID